MIIKLNEGAGVAGSIENIEEVIVNGNALSVGRYIDIGLIDSMLDMLLETAGAIIVAMVYIFSKGKCTVELICLLKLCAKLQNVLALPYGNL